MGRRLVVLMLLALGVSTATVGVPQPTNSTVLAQRLASGEQLMRAGDYQSAISQFRRALQIDPNSPDAHHYLGWCYLRTDQLKYAVSSFSTALTVAPGLTSARRGLGIAYYRLGRYRESVVALRPIMGDLAGDVEMQLVYGRSLLAIGQAQEAASDS